MSTITREFTKEQLQQIIETDHVQCGEASALARIALASIEAKPYGYVHKAVYEETGSCGLSNDHEAYRDSLSHIAVYTAKPAPVSVPDEKVKGDGFELNGPLSCYQAGKIDGWNEYRAAMLQSFGNSKQLEPVTTTYKLSDAVEALRNSGIAIDAEKIQEDMDALNSLVIPDGWVACSERMPELPKYWADMAVIIAHDDQQYGTEALYCRDGAFRWGRDEEPIQDVTHWMLLPAAPKQEVK